STTTANQIGHVIDHQIDVDSDANIVAPAYHACKLSFRPGASHQTNTIVSVGADEDVGTTVATDSDASASAAASGLVARDHVAVGARRQAGLEALVQIVALQVEGDETASTTAESDLVATIVPPIVQRGTGDGVAETDHVVNLTPSVFTRPAATARVVGVDDRRAQVAVTVRWRSLVTVVEEERAHDARNTERVGQHERVRHLVVLRDLVREHFGTTGTVAALVVVIVNEHEGKMGRQEAPLRTPVDEPSELVVRTEGTTDLGREAELGNRTEVGVFVLADRLTAQIDHFLRDEGTSVRRESLVGWQVVHAAVDGLQISGPHVLDGVHTETGDTVVDHLVHQIDDLVAHPAVALIQIRQSYQLAVAHLDRVVVVRDRAHRVEVVRAVRHSRELHATGVRRRTTGSTVRADRCHVVDDQIDVDANTDRITAADHVRKLSLTTRAGVQVVRDRLVTFPPRPTWAPHDRVLRRGRHLHTGITLRRQEALALVGNVVPLPLEQMHNAATIAPLAHH
uniref:Uncharacterized protein n=1 Tax=Anopheles farauti TaxID=69004 RepID=A0A182Q601_9DIPT